MKNVYYFSKINNNQVCLLKELEDGGFYNGSFFIPLNSKNKPYSRYSIVAVYYRNLNSHKYHNLTLKLKNNCLVLENFNVSFRINKKGHKYIGHSREIDFSKNYVEISPKNSKILDKLFELKSLVLVGFFTKEELHGRIW